MNVNQYRTLSGFAGLPAVAALALAFISLTPSLPAQSPAPGQPARAVRLSYVDGKVQLSQGGQIIANPAVINAPLFEGTQIATGDDGKAEVQFEDGSVARLSPDTSLTLKTLDGEGSAGYAEMVVDRGLAYFELQSGDQSGQIRVLFGDSAVTASGFSVIRVDMDNPPGAMAVFNGNAHVERASGGSLDLHGGESAGFNGPDASNPDIAEAIQPDSWDSWNSDRDQALNTEASSQTPATSELAGANAANPAWSDLDANGNWYNVPNQGYVWSPYDASNPGFDPYGNGSWIATPGYGYMWASAYSWGYLPYQCGAWNFYDGFGWGWAPGSGGCNPWWGTGFYGGPSFGVVPIGYRPLRRPVFGPGPGRWAGHPIRVNRTPIMDRAAFNHRSGPAVIAGHTVEPLHTMPARSVFARGSMSSTVRVYPGSATNRPGANRSGYVANRPGYTPRPQGNFNRPVAPAPTYTPHPAPQPRNIPAPRTYSPPPSSNPGGHYSGGGGGNNGGFGGGNPGGGGHMGGGNPGGNPGGGGHMGGGGGNPGGGRPSGGGSGGGHR